MMVGRYGSDELGKVMLFVSLGLMVISFFVRYRIIYLLAVILLVLAYVRMFSKNVAKRYQENQRFVKWRYGLMSRKTHHIYKCPACHQKVRVPRGRGRIEIRCPKCSTRFVKKS